MSYQHELYNSSLPHSSFRK